MDELLEDEELAVAIPDGHRYRRILVRESEHAFRLRLGRDPRAAADHLRTLAVNGSLEAQLGWAHVLLDGYGVERDPAAACRWFRHAALAGCADAANMLGRCHELGWGTVVDPVQAAHWYRRAADRRHAWGEFNLAALLAQGNGVPVDVPAALTLLVRSARQGNPKAMNMLGRFRESGAYAPSRPRSARLWYRLAAHGGCFRGQFHHARHLLASGACSEAARWLRASFQSAPADFRREAAALLADSPSETIRRIARDALAARDGVRAA